MLGHRFAGLLEQQTSEQIKPASFVLCPLGGAYSGSIAFSWAQQHIYQLALQEAQAVASPRRFDPETAFALN